MEKQNFQLLVVGMGMLIIGLIIGCVASMHCPWKRGPMERDKMMQMMHQMPDGSMMSGSMTGGRMMNEQKAADTSMQGMMHSMTAGLSGKTGDEFDKAFLDEMVVHHQGAVDMAQMVLKVSSREDLKKFAQEIIRAQTSEIGTMKKWRIQWFGQ